MNKKEILKPGMTIQENLEGFIHNLKLDREFLSDAILPTLITQENIKTLSFVISTLERIKDNK
jgi:hypothetical protein